MGKNGWSLRKETFPLKFTWSQWQLYESKESYTIERNAAGVNTSLQIHRIQVVFSHLTSLHGTLGILEGGGKNEPFLTPPHATIIILFSPPFWNSPPNKFFMAFLFSSFSPPPENLFYVSKLFACRLVNLYWISSFSYTFLKTFFVVVRLPPACIFNLFLRW